MPIVNPNAARSNAGVGSTPANHNSLPGGTTFARFAQASADIARSFLNESARVCAGLSRAAGVATSYASVPSEEELSVGRSSDRSSDSSGDDLSTSALSGSSPQSPQVIRVHPLIDPTTATVNGRMQTLSTQRKFKKAIADFKSGMNTLHQKIQRALPPVIEGNERVKPERSALGGAKARNPVATGAEARAAAEFAKMGNFDFDSAFNPFRANSSTPGLAEQFAAMGNFNFDNVYNPFRGNSSTPGLAEQFAAMGNFNFDSAYNPFRAASSLVSSLTSNSASLTGSSFSTDSSSSTNSSLSTDSSLASKQSQKSRSQRIVDRVPFDPQSARQQMVTNLRGKIIAASFKSTGQVNIHNEKALNKFLRVLERTISDDNVVAFGSLSSAQATSMFESFCKQFGVSPFSKGHEEI